MPIHLPAPLAQLSQQLADLVFMLLPRSKPSRQALLECKIIAHRGEHNNRDLLENTLAAFDKAHSAGVWGVELDVRWTRDLQPVVIHDENAKRVFGVDLEIHQTSLAELKKQLPQLPSLADVISRYGGKMHLMVELKAHNLNLQPTKTEQGKTKPDKTQYEKTKRLRELFSNLTGGVDFHFMALDLDLFELVDFVDNKCLLPIAEMNVGDFSRLAKMQNLAGISGHYVLLGKTLLAEHQGLGQKVGTGFATSRLCFYRELNRGVDWIFTNRAVKLRAIQQKLLRNS